MVLSTVLQQAEGPLYIVYIGLAILGMVGAGAGILAYIRGNLAKGTIELLQTANTALTNEVNAMKLQRAEDAATILACKSDVVRLTELVTQTKSINKLNEDEATRHAEQMDMLAKVIDAVLKRPQPPLRQPRRAAHA